MKSCFPKLLLASVIAAGVCATSNAQIPAPPGLPNLEIHIARHAPPHLRYERRSHRPYRDAVWIGGFWDWQGGDWVWVSGRWERPGDRSIRWVRPRYHREYGSYRYEPGHWSNQRIIEGDEYHRFREEHRHGDRDHRDRDRDGDSRDR